MRHLVSPQDSTTIKTNQGSPKNFEVHIDRQQFVHVMVSSEHPEPHIRKKQILNEHVCIISVFLRLLSTIL